MTLTQEFPICVLKIIPSVCPLFLLLSFFFISQFNRTFKYFTALIIILRGGGECFFYSLGGMNLTITVGRSNTFMGQQYQQICSDDINGWLWSKNGIIQDPSIIMKYLINIFLQMHHNTILIHGSHAYLISMCTFSLSLNIPPFILKETVLGDNL